MQQKKHDMKWYSNKLQNLRNIYNRLHETFHSSPGFFSALLPEFLSVIENAVNLGIHVLLGQEDDSDHVVIICLKWVHHLSFTNAISENNDPKLS